MQLIGSIRNILKKDFAADTDYNYREVSIYPILITHDHQYDATGLNNLLNHWFQDEVELLAEEGLFTQRIKPLVVVNIDALIYHQVALRDTFSLHDVLDKYYKFTYIRMEIKFLSQAEVESYLMSKLTPFAYFLDNFFSNLGLKTMPPMLKELGLTLFKNEQPNLANDKAI